MRGHIRFTTDVAEPQFEVKLEHQEAGGNSVELTYWLTHDAAI